MTSVTFYVLTGVLLVAFAVASVLAWRTTESLRRRLDQFDADAARSDEHERGPDWAHLAETIAAIEDAVVIADRSGAVVLHNPAALRFREARHADAIAEEAIGDLIGEALDGDPVQRELQLYGPPPESLRLRALPLRSGAQIIGAAVFLRDMSEVRRIDEVRRDFVANVSHELKTPIGALSLLAETILASDDPAVMHQLAERVLGEADRLSQIVDDLLDLSVIEANEVSQREPIAVGRLVHEAVDRVRFLADDQGIEILISPIDPDLSVMCDHQQVASAITNLLENAVKYSETSEDAAPVVVDAVHEGDRLAITIRDSGIGIPTRDLERVFERFYRVDRARSRDTGGTGLGLSIVRHVAQAHGGEVTVESREGEGSTFRFVLPDRPLRAVPGVAEAS